VAPPPARRRRSASATDGSDEATASGDPQEAITAADAAIDPETTRNWRRDSECGIGMNLVDQGGDAPERQAGCSGITGLTLQRHHVVASEATIYTL